MQAAAYLVQAKLWKLAWHPGWSKSPVEEARCYSPGRILNASCIMPCQDSQSNSLIHEYFHTFLIIFILICIISFHI